MILYHDDYDIPWYHHCYYIMMLYMYVYIYIFHCTNHYYSSSWYMGHTVDGCEILHPVPGFSILGDSYFPHWDFFMGFFYRILPIYQLWISCKDFLWKIGDTPIFIPVSERIFFVLNPWFKRNPPFSDTSKDGCVENRVYLQAKMV